MAAAHLVISGNSVVLAADDGELIDVLRKGQGVLTNVLSLSNVKQEVDAQIDTAGDATVDDLDPGELPAILAH